jgi:hypothetical protein
MVNGLIGTRASSPHGNAGETDCESVNLLHYPGVLCGDINAHRRNGQPVRFIDDTTVASLRGDKGGHHFAGAPIGNNLD